MDLSVIICTYNRCASLQKMLQSLAEMDVPASLSWELIVVDNNSTDGTRNVVESFAARSKLNVRYLFEPIPGLSQARNAGIRAACGRVVTFADDDVYVSRDWIAKIKQGFDEYQPACLGGRILRDPTLPLPDWWDRSWRSTLGHFDRGNEAIVAGPQDRVEYAWGGNISFRRDVFEKYGLFRTDLGRTPSSLGLGEESEMVLRLRQNGEIVVYYPQAVVVHSPAVDRLSKQYLRRLTYRLGVSTCLIDMEFPKHWPRIFRIPRWRYKWAAQTLWDAVRHGFIGDSTVAFQNRLNLVMLAGYSITAFRGRRNGINP